MDRNGEGNDKGDADRILNTNGGDPASTARGSELLSLLLKRPLAPETPQSKQTLLERSKTPPLLPTVSKEEASRPLTPPARLPRNTLSRSLFPANAPNSPSKRGDKEGNRRMQRPPGFQARGYVNGRKGEHEEGDPAKAVEAEEKRYNELGMEIKDGVAAEGQQNPVARWRLQRNITPVDDRAPQNKPKGPDGSKGFAAGRGRLLNPPDTPKVVLGEPPKDASSLLGSRPGSADVSKGRSDVGADVSNSRGNGSADVSTGRGNVSADVSKGRGDGRRPKQQADEKDLEVQLKIAQFLVQRELEESNREGGVARTGESSVTRVGRPSDEEAPFAPPPSRQGSRKVEGSPAGSVNGDTGSVHGEKATEVSLTSVDETGGVSNAGASNAGVSKADVGNAEVDNAEVGGSESGNLEGGNFEGGKTEASNFEVGKLGGGSAGVSSSGVSKTAVKPVVRREPQSGGDLQRLTEFLEGTFGKQAGASVPRADFVTRAADEWLETDLVSARNKVFAVLEKCVGTAGYSDLVDLEKHLKATLNELRRYRSFVKERSDAVASHPDGPKLEIDGPKAEIPDPRVEKLEGEIGRLKYDLGAAQMEIGRLEAELAFERVNGGVKEAGAEGGLAQLERELERVRLELRAWQGEVEQLKGALDKSEELRQAEGLSAKDSLAAKEVESAHLQLELGNLRMSAQQSEESLQRSFESERRSWEGEIERLRLKAAADAEEIERLRSKGASEAEEIGRLMSMLTAASDDAALQRRLQNASVSDMGGYGQLSDFGGRHGADSPRFANAAGGGSAQQHREGGGVGDILDQLFSTPSGGGGGSGMTWQQQELTRQDSQGSYSPFPQRQQSEAPAGTHMTWQQQEMTRQQEPPHRTLSGGHFVGQPRPPVLHETDLAFAHQQRQIAQQQRLFQGGHYGGAAGPPPAPQFPKYPAQGSGSFWDNPVISAGSARGPYSHMGHPPQPGPQRTGSGHPYPQAPPQGLWPREMGHVSLARTASAVEQEMLGRTRQAQSFGYSCAMPIPVSVLLAAGRAGKQTHDVAHQRPATSEELGLIEDDEVLFKGR